MTEQEQIEEMVAVMAASNDPFVDVPIEIMPQVAKALYNAGYRKVPDGIMSFPYYKKRFEAAGCVVEDE